MFEEEFNGLPPEVADALKARVEETVRIICRRYAMKAHESSIRLFTSEELHAMLSGPIELANHLKLFYQEPKN